MFGKRRTTQVLPLATLLGKCRKLVSALLWSKVLLIAIVGGYCAGGDLLWGLDRSQHCHFPVKFSQNECSHQDTGNATGSIRRQSFFLYLP